MVSNRQKVITLVLFTMNEIMKHFTLVMHIVIIRSFIVNNNSLNLFVLPKIFNKHVKARLVLAYMINYVDLETYFVFNYAYIRSNHLEKEKVKLGYKKTFQVTKHGNIELISDEDMPGRI